MRIVKPHPEVKIIPDWLKLYADGKLKPGAVQEEPFTLFIDSHEQMIVGDYHRVASPTVRFIIESGVCWRLAARSDSVYSAYMKGLDMRAEGDFTIRDMELVDEILKQLYDLLVQEGHDVARLFSEQIAGAE